MIDYESVKIESFNLHAKGTEDIYQCLKVLYTTPVGTVPFDRNFGLDMSFLDDPIPVAKGKLMVEYRQKTMEYEPRVSVQDVTFTQGDLNGTLVPKVVIEYGT